MVVAIGWAYVRYGGLPWMQSVFYGVGAAVIGIIAMSAYKLTKRSVGKDKLLGLIYSVAAMRHRRSPRPRSRGCSSSPG